MENYLIKVELNDGKTLILNLAYKLNTIRFQQLKDKELFKSATTDGYCIHWNELIELSNTEIFEISE
jgi:hypothetical protein